MEELAISELVKHVGTLGLAGTIIIIFFWGAITLFRKITVQFFAQNEKAQENNVKMIDGLNQFSQNINQSNIYLKEKLSELKNDISNLATFEQVDSLKYLISKILEKVEDLENKS